MLKISGQKVQSNKSTLIPQYPNREKINPNLPCFLLPDFASVAQKLEHQTLRFGENKSNVSMNFDYLVTSIEQTHSHFQHQAAKAVNVSLTLRNWLIGYYIVEFEQKGEDRAIYGDKLFDTLSSRLKFIKGIDRRSLYRFKDFYLLYPHVGQYIQSEQNDKSLPELFSFPIVGTVTPQLGISQKVGTMTPQSENSLLVPAKKLIQNLSYSHIEQLLQFEQSLKRTFYEIECIKGTWSVRELKRQINSLYYERSGMSIKPQVLSEITQQKAEISYPSEIVKSLYAFEFLGLKAKDAVEENDLESALLDH
ncbi:DUF1016 N-terminal domain-containing protein, partial [Aquiflexum sp.]|uniref:DUF1016 N-terminal domain-containing protein n=1 Tax=Aquiflexum sp. TaxID=1872584 RepID=UPI0035938397